MKFKLLLLAATAFLITPIAHAEDLHNELTSSNKQPVPDQVYQVYQNYSLAHPTCNYPANPRVYSYPVTFYTLTNPYAHDHMERPSYKFKIGNFVISRRSSDPVCGTLSIKCAAYDNLLHTNYYCERIHNGDSSNPALLSDPQYNKYLAYQTIYNQTAVPKAQKKFGNLHQYSPLDAFPPYSMAQNPDSYEYTAVIYSGFPYPPPSPTLQPNYSNGDYGFLFFGSGENLKSVCQSIQHDNLSPTDASVRFSEFLGVPPDSPDSVRVFNVFKLRNNPHIYGQPDGNMFRPCLNDGSIETQECSGSALNIPHDCNAPPPPPYDGTTLGSFLARQFYDSYCDNTPSKKSGMPIHFPWTGQGFTYDWYPWTLLSKSVQGTSEYVPAINQTGSDNIVVANKKTLEEFLLNCDLG